MATSLRQGVRLLVLGALVVLATGCATQRDVHRAYYTRSHPELAERARAIRTTGILPPDIKVYSVTAGGVEEERDDWSAQGRDYVVDGIRQHAGVQVAEIKPASTDRELQELVEDVQALYGAVSASIATHALGQGLNVFQHKVQRFEYSVGPIDRLLAQRKADALLIVKGYDEVSTGGRRAARVLSSINPFTQRMASDSAGMSMALVDRTGAVLWFNVDVGGGDIDFRDRASTSGLVKTLMHDFPRAGK
jgi:hypothetical protein